MKILAGVLSVLIYLVILVIPGWWISEVELAPLSIIGNISLFLNGLCIGILAIISAVSFNKWFNSKFTKS